MSRIVIDLSRDLPRRAVPPTEAALAGVFGGLCVGKYCRSDADCCPTPGAVVPVVCVDREGLSTPLHFMGRCRYYGF